MATIKAKDGTQIYYKDWGAGKPVLFSHGWPLDADMWDSQLNYGRAWVPRHRLRPSRLWPFGSAVERL